MAIHIFEEGVMVSLGSDQISFTNYVADAPYLFVCTHVEHCMQKKNWL
jgi:hypothetical protein